MARGAARGGRPSAWPRGHRGPQPAAAAGPAAPGAEGRLLRWLRPSVAARPGPTSAAAGMACPRCQCTGCRPGHAGPTADRPPAAAAAVRGPAGNPRWCRRRVQAGTRCLAPGAHACTATPGTVVRPTASRHGGCGGGHAEPSVRGQLGPRQPRLRAGSRGRAATSTVARPCRQRPAPQPAGTAAVEAGHAAATVRASPGHRRPRPAGWQPGPRQTPVPG